MPTEEQIRGVLTEIPDPEIGVSIVELGLVYGIEIDPTKKIVTVRITLTSIGCPLFDHIAGPIREMVMELPDVSDVLVELTFDPPWSTDRMSESAKAELGF